MWATGAPGFRAHLRTTPLHRQSWPRTGSASRSSDLTLLNSQIGSPAVKAAGYSLPFANFPPTTTLTNALRPFPQYGPDYPDWLHRQLLVRLAADEAECQTETQPYGAGDLYVGEVDHRTGHVQRLDQSRHPEGAGRNSIPQALSLNMIYQTPHLKSGLLGGNKMTRQIFSDWQVSAVMRYQSGALITAPGSNNNLGTYLAGASTQYMARVPGQPLYLADPNGKIDPTKQLLLNPAAWTECGPTATFGCGAPRYTDFRQRRSPQEDSV